MNNTKLNFLTAVIIFLVIVLAIGFSISFLEIESLSSELEQYKVKEPEIIPVSQEELELKLAERLIEGISSANITIEFDDSGYNHGWISIYYEKPVVSPYDIYPSPDIFPFSDQQWFYEID